jgi:hypothetical protein
VKFGHVEGLCVPVLVDGERLARVTVYLETDMGIDIVREVEVDLDVAGDVSPDLYWEADQWTQETIATILIPRGWELLGATDPPTHAPDEIPRSPRYALRTPFWVPPPGWNDENT